MGICWHIDLLHGPAVISRVIHTGGNGGRCRIKVLHLLRHIAQIPQMLRQLHCRFHIGTRMGGHQIWNQILLFTQLLIHGIVFLYKLTIYTVFRFSHQSQNSICHMLRRYLQLTADMILT